MAEEEPLPSPPLLQDKWVTIQKNTFTNFVNQQLRETEHQIEELYSKHCYCLTLGLSFPVNWG